MTLGVIACLLTEARVGKLPNIAAANTYGFDVTEVVLALAFKYTVLGNLHTDSLDGKKAYMMLYDTNEVIDSAEISGGRFSMSGNAPRQGWARVDAGKEYAQAITSGRVLKQGNGTGLLRCHQSW